MKLFVSVKTRARETKVLQKDSTHFEVRVTALPKEGEANEAVIKALAVFLKVPKTCLKIVRGQRAREKTITVNSKQ